jgi:hypothetical protein
MEKFKRTRNFQIFLDYSLLMFCHIRHFVLIRCVSLDILCLYYLFHWKFCPYTFCHIIPDVFLDLLSPYMYCQTIRFVVIRYVLYTFCHSTFRHYKFCHWIKIRNLFQGINCFVSVHYIPRDRGAVRVHSDLGPDSRLRRGL